MSIQNPRQLSLIELAEWYKSMSETVQSLSSDIKNKLEGILTRGNLYIEELLNSPNKLRDEIDQHLQEVQPFEWNRGNRKEIIDDNVEKDWEQHNNLIIFTIILGDELFLKHWGVDYPLGSAGPGLANPSGDYIEILREAKNQCPNATCERYYEYLIQELSSRLNIS